MKAILLRLLEVLLLIPAFGFIIPPIQSEPGEYYGLLPGLGYGITFLSCSLALAWKRRAENAWTISVKLFLFVIFSWLIHIRVWDHPTI